MARAYIAPSIKTKTVIKMVVEALENPDDYPELAEAINVSIIEFIKNNLRISAGVSYSEIDVDVDVW